MWRVCSDVSVFGRPVEWVEAARWYRGLVFGQLCVWVLALGAGLWLGLRLLTCSARCVREC